MCIQYRKRLYMNDFSDNGWTQPKIFGNDIVSKQRFRVILYCIINLLKPTGCVMQQQV
jgi:hypothetical protein